MFLLFDTRKTSIKILLIFCFSLLFFFLSTSKVLADQTWDGGGGVDTNWNNCVNWTLNTCPVTTDIAIFNATSSNNATVNTNISVKGISIQTGYAGTITQSNTFTITLGTSGYNQAVGTFVGGDSIIDDNGDFIISAGAFTSTSSILSITGNFTKTNSPTFTHNSGTVTFDGATVANTTISASSFTFNLVTFNRSFNSVASNVVLTIASGTTIPLGNDPTITIVNTSGNGSYSLTNSGTITIGTGIFTANVNGNFTNSVTTGVITGSNTSLVMNGNLVNSGSITMSSCNSFDFNAYGGSGFGSLTNNSGATFAMLANPTFNVSASFIVSSGSISFPTTGVTLTLDGTYTGNSSVDASGITFVTPVVINRSYNSLGSNNILTIASGTTIPLGNSPTITLVNTHTNGGYALTNSGTITVGTGVFTANVEGNFTNSVTTGVITGSNTSWVMNGDLINNGSITMNSCNTFDFNIYGSGAGSLTNNSGATFNMLANPTFTVNGSFIVSSGSISFPTTDVTLTLDGAYTGNSLIDASGITFVTPVVINRSYSAIGSNTILSIASGTTIPLGNSPTITLVNTHTNGGYALTNSGTITVGTGVFTANVEGNFTNSVTTGVITGSNTSWVMNGSLINNGSITMSSCNSFGFNTYGSGAGSLTNSSGATFNMLANPTFTVNGSFIVSSGSISFPTTGVTLTLDGGYVGNTLVDSPSITFNTPVIINRSIWDNSAYTLTIASGTTIPLGNSASITLLNTNTGGGYHLTNSGTITIGTGVFTANVEGNITNSVTTGVITGTNTSWVMNGSLVNNGSITMSSCNLFDFNIYDNLGTGSLTNASGATFVMSANPTFTINGSFIVSSGSISFPTTGVTLTLDGGLMGNSSVDSPGITFVTPVVVNRTSGFNNSTYTLTIASGTTIPLGNSPTITLVNPNTGGGYHLTNSGTMTIGSGTFTANIDGNLTNSVTTGVITGTNTVWVLNGNLINNGSITMSSSNSFDINTYGNLGLGNLTNATGATFAIAANAVFSSTGNFTVNTGSISFPITGISLTLDGTSGTQTLTTPYITSFAAFSKTAASTLGLTGGITTGDFTFSAGTIGNPGSLYFLKISGNFSQSSATAFGGTNLPITFEGGNNQTISKTAGTFTSVMVVNKSGGVLTLSTAFGTTGTTCTVTSGIFHLNGKTFTCGSTFTIQTGGTLRLVGTESVTPVLDSGSTVEYVGDGDALADSYLFNNWSYSNLKVSFIDSADTLNPIGAITVSGNVTLSNGILVSGTTFNIGGDFTNTGGTFTHNSGIVNMNATTSGHLLSGTMTGASQFYNLTFNGSGGAWTFGANSATVANDLTVTLGTLTAPSTTLTVGGNFTKTGGTFTHNSGTIVFNDNTKTSTLTYDAAITFSSFTVSTASKILNFDNVDQTNITGTLTINGQACNTFIKLYSDSTPNQFEINATGTVNINYAEIKDSNAIASLTANNSLRISNNTNWTINGGICYIDIIGICKAYDQVTDCGDTGTIKVAFNTTVQTQEQTTVAGNWSISGLTYPSIGTIITIYIEGAADADKAVSVTKYDGTGDITGVKLFKEHLTLGSDDNVTLTNTDISTYDNSVSGNANIFHDINAGILTVDNTNHSTEEKLYILAGNIFQSGGIVNTHDLDNQGTFVPEANTINVNGSWNNTGTFTASSGTINMTSTLTGEVLTGTMTGASAFNNLTFNGSGGAWSFAANGATVANNFTITAGTVTAPSTTLTITGNYSNLDGFVHNSGTVLMNATTTGKTVDTTGGGAFYILTFNGSGGAWVFSANPTVILNDFTIINGTVTAPNDILNIGGSYSNAGTFTNNSGSVVMNATSDSKTLSGNMTGSSSFYNLFFDGINGEWSFDANSATVLHDFYIFNGVVTAPSTTLEIRGNYSNSGDFIHNNGTVLMSAIDGGHTLSGSMAIYSAFNNLTFNGIGGTWTFGANTTALEGNFTITNGSVTAPSTTLTVGGNYSNSGTFTNNSGTVIMTSMVSQTLGGNMVTTSSFYNLTFKGRQTVPWASVWSFGSNSATVLNDFSSIPWNPQFGAQESIGGTVIAPSTILTIGGNFLNDGTFTNNNGTVVMNATDAGNTLSGTMTGASAFNNLTFNGSGGAWSFGVNNATVANNFTITLGIVTAPSTTLTIAKNFSNSATFTNNSGNVVLNGTNQTILGNTTFNNLSKIVTSPDTLSYEGHATNTTTVNGTWTMKGIAGNLLTLYSTSSPTKWRINPTGTRDIEYLSVKDSNNVDIPPIDTFGLHSVSEGNNINWIFYQAPVGSIVINSNDTYAHSNSVTLTITGSDNFDDPSSLQMMLSSTPDFIGASYQPFASLSSWNFNNTSEVKTIYLKLKNTLGTESSVFSDNIIYDTVSPVGLSFTSPINTTINLARPEFKWHIATDTLSDLDKYKLTVTFVDNTSFSLDNLESFDGGIINSYEHSQYSIWKDGEYIYLKTKDSGLWGVNENDGQIKDGLVSVRVESYDKSGNMFFVTQTFTSDLIPPAIVLNSIDNFVNLNIQPDSTTKSYTLLNTKPLFKGNISSGELSTVSIVATSSSSGTRNCNVTTSSNWECRINNALTIGRWNVNISATDNVGNVNSLPTITLNIIQEQLDTVVIDTPLDVPTTPVVPPTDNSVNQPLENNYSLNLTIVDNNNNPVEGARITFPNDENVYITDKNGNVNIGNILEGQYKINIDYNGKTGEQTISVDGTNKNLSKTIAININFFDVIIQNILNFINNTLVPELKSIANNPASPIGVIGALAISVMSLILAYPSSITSISNFFSGYLWFYKRKRKNRYGMVFDSMSNKGLPFVMIRVINKDNGKVIKDTLSDINGRYSLLVDPEIYTLQFDLQPYTQFNKQYDATKEGSEQITENIGLQLTLDRTQNKISLRKIFINISNAIFYLGFILTLIILIFNFQILTVLFTILYLIQILMLYLRREPRGWGIVSDLDTSKNIPGVFVSIIDPVENRQLNSQITDNFGRFGFIPDTKTCYLKINALGYELSELNQNLPKQTLSDGENIYEIHPDKINNLKVYMKRVDSNLTEKKAFY